MKYLLISLTLSAAALCAADEEKLVGVLSAWRSVGSMPPRRLGLTEQALRAQGLASVELLTASGHPLGTAVRAPAAGAGGGHALLASAALRRQRWQTCVSTIASLRSGFWT